MRSPSFPLLALVAACRVGPEVPFDDPASLPRPVDPIPGGGVDGAPLGEALTVFVVGRGDAPLPGARVQVGPHRAETNAEGRAEWTDTRFEAPAEVHVTAPGYAHHSTFGLASSVLTVRLHPTTAQGPAEAPGVATVRGAVGGWHRLPAPSAGTTRVIEVLPVGAGPMAILDQPPRPGSATLDAPSGVPMNIVLDGAPPFPAWSDYALRLDTRAAGLVAFGSTFDPSRNPPLDTTHLGLRLGLEVEDGDALDGMEVTLGHALDQRLIASAEPSALERSEVTFALSFSEGWMIPLDVGPLGAQLWRTARAPRLEGALADAGYLVALRRESAAKVGALPAREALAVVRTTLLEADFKGILPVPAAPSLAGRTLESPPPMGADLMRIRIRDRSGSLRWEGWMLEPVAGPVTLPAMDEDPLAEAQLELEASAFDVGPHRPERVSFSHVAPRSEAHHRVRLDR